MPIIDLLYHNLTALSEESGVIFSCSSTCGLGELALSVLTSMQNPQTRGDLKSTNNLWQQIRLMYETRQGSRVSAGAGIQQIMSDTWSHPRATRLQNLRKFLK